MSVLSVPKLGWWVFFVGVLGLALGYLTAPAQAATVYSARVNPGGSVEWLTCTWHGSGGCGSGDGDLDWRGGGPCADYVYFRGWNYRSGSYGTIGSVSTVQQDGTCKSVHATVKNTLGSTVGKVYYTHTDISSAATWTLYGDPDYNYQTQYIANVVDDELEDCVNADPPLWTAAHLHQGKDANWSHQSWKFTSTGTNYIYGVNDWQYYKSWSY